MVGHIQMDDTAAVVGEDNEDEQNAEGRRWDREEVHRRTLREVRSQKGAPSRRGRRRSPAEILGDGRFGDVDAQLLEFAVNTRRAPERIGPTHLSDQLSDVGANGRSTGTTTR